MRLHLLLAIALACAPLPGCDGATPAECGAGCNADAARCPAGTFGASCSAQCPGGAAEPCLGHGVCDDGATGSGACTCAGGWAGEACDVCTQLAPAAPSAPVEVLPAWFGDLDYSPKHGVWLVVTGGGPIYGRIVGRDGSPVTDTLQVSPVEHGTYTPLVSYAATHDRFLTVWNVFTNASGPVGIYGRFVAPDGTLEPVFHLGVDGMLNQGSQRVAGLRYDARNQRFVLVMMGGTRLLTIGVDGTVGPVVDLATVDGGNWNPKIAINEDANEYCVLYDQRSNGVGGVPALAARRVSAADFSLGAETSAAMATTSSDIAYDRATGGYLVVHSNGPGTSARFLRSCDVNDSMAGDFVVSSSMGTARVAANPTSRTFGVFGINWFGTDNLHAVLDGAGNVLSNGAVQIPPVNGEYVPMIAADLDDGTFAGVTDRDYVATYLVTGIGVRVSCSP